MATLHTALQVLGISTSLIAAGGIATLSLFDVPELQAQPASRSLPSTRWLFSRGSHIFPQAAGISSASFAYLAYRTVHRTRYGYIAAVILTISIAPFTTIAMIPTNFRLIEMNQAHGGTRSARSGAQQQESHGKSAEDSVAGQCEGEEFTDLSGPQAKTDKDTCEAEDEEVRLLLAKFGRLNATRAVLMAAGGIVGLTTALI